MTPDQYWDGDSLLAKYYRMADEISQKRKNEHLWLQGMYIYEALCDVAPVMNAFARKGTKPSPYPSRPYPITDKDIAEQKKLKEKQEGEKARRYMESIMAKTNKCFESKRERK